MKPHLTALVFAASLCSPSLFAGPFDFLDMSTAPRTKPGTPSEILCLGDNPAGLAAMAAPVTLGAGVHTRMGVSFLSGAASFRGGDFSFAITGGTLSTGQVLGDLQFAGDAGRTLNTGSALLGGAVAWRLGDTLRLPFTLNLGAGGTWASVTLDSTLASIALLHASIQAILPMGKKGALDFSVGTRQIPLWSDNPAAGSVAMTVDGTLGLQWNPAEGFSLRLGGEVRHTPGADTEPGASVELTFFRGLTLGARANFGPSPSWQALAALQVTFGPGATGQVSFAHLPGEGSGANVIAVAAGLGKSPDHGVNRNPD